MMAASLPNCWSAHHMELLLLSTPGGRKGEALCAKSCIIQYLHRKMYLKQGPPLHTQWKNLEWEEGGRRSVWLFARSRFVAHALYFKLCPTLMLSQQHTDRVWVFMEEK